MPKRSLSAGQNPRGWVKGFEPLVFGTTIRRFNQLSYTHHIQFITGAKSSASVADAP